MNSRVIIGDCRAVLPTLEAGSVQTCVTSPPYWGLRDYGIPPSIWGGDPACEHEWGDQQSKKVGGGQPGEKVRWQHTGEGVKGHAAADAGAFCRCGSWRGVFGLEPTPALYVEHAVAVFREVRRVLRDDGTLWLNLGDSYHNGDKGGYAKDRVTAEDSLQVSNLGANFIGAPNRQPQPGMKPKDLCGIPWMVAFALRADGWYLRQDIIWAKPNPMPESVRDRCTKSHEYLFLLAKSERYYFDADAIAEPSVYADEAKYDNGKSGHGGGESHAGQGSSTRKFRLPTSGNKERKPASARGVPVDTGGKSAGAVAGSVPWEGITRNKRSVWTVGTKPFKEAHFATFPPALIEPCILAGSKPGETVLDPFGGSGTTGQVSEALGRKWLLIELNGEYGKLCADRTRQTGMELVCAS